METDRCEDTSAMLNYGLDVKPMRMVASPGSGPRHTIDNILGLVRKDENERDRSTTPGNGESAGEETARYQTLLLLGKLFSRL